MVLIRIIYYDVDTVKQMDIQHTDWQTLAPNTILKIFVKIGAETWKEIFGYGGYILHQHSDNKWYFGGINTTTMSTLSGEKISLPVETFTKSHPSLKLGVEIPNDLWNQVNAMVFV
jgi:hypothetical protein